MAFTAAAPYTGKETKVLISYSVAGMGFVFVQWLRRMIMTRRNYASIDSVYVDTVSMRQLAPADTQDRIRMFFQGITPSTIDVSRRFAGPEYENTAQHPDQGRFTYLGAHNKMWNANFKQAMSEAHTMIFAITDGWLESIWCGLEWSQYINESGRRPADRPLRGLLLSFAQGSKYEKTFSSLGSVNAPNITVLALTKVNGVLAGAAEPGAIVGGWAISPSDLTRVLDAIPAD